MIAADDQLTIHQVLYRYCRAMDRMDAALALECFEPDAHLEYSRLFVGSPQEFVDWLWPVHARMIGHTHQVSNILAELTGEATAASETYVQVTLRALAEDGMVDLVGKGRYLDRWRRDPDDGWRITHRTYISDLATIVPVASRDLSAVITPAKPGLPVITGSRDPDDPSYHLFAT